ncbi:PREDICTED: tRNA pseudouridine synthase A, mitochondrial [Nicotiana attenuata]|uniref:Trna uridine synthase n=1 Tax=Nicotiana attenuata TaxID=49451 RepID=A0A1J6HW02_NICAT|nr:PREDICTED: tRNA pseudouridine synthase A, mitochondrial [Nicotiana attenuata]OIS97052.1 putative trna uridine synthase [Nicotiana attenuata]
MENKTAPLSTIEEPELKKQKMSTTTSDDEEAATAAVAGDGPAPERKPRYKRRKIAIFFAYCGVGYQGMQKNPGAKTIEGDLEEALYQAGGVPDHDKCQPRRYDWARSARTDKGVSAVGQVVSGRFYVDPPGFIDRLNSILSPQIRIFGFKRVTNAFNAKKFCDRRRYVYFVPVFALDPSSHRDRETVLASVGSGKELVKCLECSERGRKVFGVMGKRVFDPITKSVIVVAEPGNMPNNGDAQVTLQNIESNVNVNANDVITESNMVTENGASLSEKGEETKEEVEKGDENAKAIEEQVEESVFSYGEKEKERFNRILKYYEGTHNFHNFTTRTKADDPAAKRYIISFTANSIVNVEGIEFVKCEVVGQSFMLHQIRKMIGLAVAIMRNCAPESLIQTAFRRDVNINVPMAPEVGLYLDECFFTSYNSKWKDTHEEVSLKAYTEAAEEFKMKYIYSHIASTEHKDGTMALWLHSLNYRNYPDLRGVDNGNSAGASDGSKAVEAVVEAGVGAVKNGESTDNVNSAGAVDDSKTGEAVVEAGLGAVNDGESTDNVNIAAAGDGSEVETVVEVGLSAVDNGESADAKDAEAGRDADLVTS